ncbi:MAG: Holliday junction resolvase-like protein [Candidatus Diapherotrites archaeon]|nr:Holliday junction resolvase-like protein [Candidatus Diapherotrites archaeon]
MIEILLAALILTLGVIAWLFWKEAGELKEELSRLQFEKSSQSVKYGKMSENWIPLSEQFPYNPDSFRFLGNPIDGVAFEDDKIVFCEFKASKSQLSEKQKRIRQLVEEKKVEWFELKMK